MFLGPVHGGDAHLGETVRGEVVIGEDPVPDGEQRVHHVGGCEVGVGGEDHGETPGRAGGPVVNPADDRERTHHGKLFRRLGSGAGGRWFGCEMSGATDEETPPLTRGWGRFRHGRHGRGCVVDHGVVPSRNRLETGCSPRFS